MEATMGKAIKREVRFDIQKIDKDRKRITNPLLFRLGLIYMLPLAFPTGMHVTRMDDEGCTVKVPMGFINKNPFKTMYWAVMGMAAEMAGGTILLNYAKACKPSVATYVVGCDAKFLSRGLGDVYFECNDAPLIKQKVAEAAATGEGVIFETRTMGYSKDHKPVCDFLFTWSVKGRKA